MTFEFNTSLAENYQSATQKARVLTEDWLGRNMYCPICGAPMLTHFEANKPVADFYCKDCQSEYELKSKRKYSKGIGKKIVDGEYSAMIGRITALNNPNFFFLTHFNNRVCNLVLIPNYFFVPDIIEKRKPLSICARRAGWTGCNINLDSIPEYGKIYIVRDSVEVEHDLVIETYKKVETLQTNSLDSRGWLMDVLQCVDKLGEEFTLTDVYAYTRLLEAKHPGNNNVQPKIRQQLQILRDKGFLQFTARGRYKKIK
ncbi:MAG: DpnI domain-containing protein [Paludibacteraceae bacterium]